MARRYRLDPARTSIAGYSMGGFGTFKLAAQFPDLFARAQPTVGALAIADEMMASVRWVPFLMWNAEEDELVPPALFRGASDELKRLGYRYELHVHAPATLPIPAPTPNHLMLALNDQFAPAARFLGAARVVRNPPRVTYVRNTGIDFPKLGTTADHAYWVSRNRARDTAKLGKLDVISDAFGARPAGVEDADGTGPAHRRHPRPAPVRVRAHHLGLHAPDQAPEPPPHLGHEHRLPADRPAAGPGHMRGEARREVGRAAEGPPGRLPRPRLSPRSARAGSGVHGRPGAAERVANQRSPARRSRCGRRRRRWRRRSWPRPGRPSPPPGPPELPDLTSPRSEVI